MNRSIRNSAKALIIKDGKMLAIKLQENGEVWVYHAWWRAGNGGASS